MLRTSTSISPDCSAVKRASVARSTNSTASASPRMAAAITRQKSASKPTWSPSGVEHGEAGQGVAGAAAQRSAVDDRLQGAALLDERDPGGVPGGPLGRGGGGAALLGVVAAGGERKGDGQCGRPPTGSASDGRHDRSPLVHARALRTLEARQTPRKPCEPAGGSARWPERSGTLRIDDLCRCAPDTHPGRSEQPPRRSRSRRGTGHRAATGSLVGAPAASALGGTDPDGEPAGLFEAPARPGPRASRRWGPRCARSRGPRSRPGRATPRPSHRRAARRRGRGRRRRSNPVRSPRPSARRCHVDALDASGDVLHDRRVPEGPYGHVRTLRSLQVPSNRVATLPGGEVLIRLLRSHLRRYRRLLWLVVGLQAVQTVAALLLPTINAHIIDNGVLRGDIDYIWSVGAVDARLHARPDRVRRRRRCTSAPGWPWASGATFGPTCSTRSPTSRPGRSARSVRRRSSPASPTTCSRSRCSS